MKEYRDAIEQFTSLFREDTDGIPYRDGSLMIKQAGNRLRDAFMGYRKAVSEADVVASPPLVPIDARDAAPAADGNSVLVVDDEPQARRLLRIALVERGFAVCDQRSGEDALDHIRRSPPDLILLDLKLPGMDGISACRAIRTCSEAPIIVVSVRNTTRDKIEAFAAGADDYLTKPFEMDELVARLRAITRRLTSMKPRIVRLGETEIDLQSHEVRRGGESIHLTAKEFKLLSFFIDHPNQVLPHSRILQAVWGPDYGTELDYLRVFMNQLRKKIEPVPSDPAYIVTEPHEGYRFDPLGGG